MRLGAVLGLGACVMAGWAAAAGEPGGADERPTHSRESVEHMSEPELKTFYLDCARASMRQRLGGGEIALCSVGYERLLQEVFDGDFRAFLEWRRGARRALERGEPPVTR